MFMCEDWPCCGHEQGCCPRYDEAGNQLDMVCTCGRRLPIDNPTSICNGCLNAEDGWFDEEDCDEDEECDEDSPIYADYNDFHDEF